MTTSPLQPGRRRFISGLVATGAVAGTAAAVGARPWTWIVEISDAPIGDRLAALLPPSESTRRVGRSYLALRPEHRHVDRLVGALAHSLEIDQERPPADVAGRAARQVHAELSGGEVLRLEGWIASPTEARLAALTTLLGG